MLTKPWSTDQAVSFPSMGKLDGTLKTESGAVGHKVFFRSREIRARIAKSAREREIRAPNSRFATTGSECWGVVN